MWMLLMILFLFHPIKKEEMLSNKGNDIFLPLKGRTEVSLTPLPDTLYASNEYKLIFELDPKYVFSDLYFDKGVATRTDNIITIRPRTNSTTADTATLRIICYSNGKRILLYHPFVVIPLAKVYPRLPKKQAYILLNNNVLERNLTYNKELFLSNAFIEYYEEGLEDTVEIVGLTLSLTNADFQKYMFNPNGVMTKEMLQEIKGLKAEVLTYIRLDVKIGKTRKSIWTRFKMKV